MLSPSFWSDRKLCRSPGQTSSTAPRVDCESWNGGNWRGGSWRAHQLVPGGEKSTVASLLLLLLLAMVPCLYTRTDNFVLNMILNNVLEEISQQIKYDRFIVGFSLNPKHRKTWESQFYVRNYYIKQTLLFQLFYIFQSKALYCTWRYNTKGLIPHW